MYAFVMVSLILIDLGISILIFRPLIHFTHLFSIFWGISLSHGILKSQRLWYSILPINNTDDMNPNGSHIEAELFSIFILVKRWFSVGISILNVSFCLSQFKPSIFVSFAFVRRCSFAKFNYFSELRLLVFKFGSLEWHLWSLTPPPPPPPPPSFLKQFYGIRLYFFNFLQAFFPSHQIINVHIISDFSY